MGEARARKRTDHLFGKVPKERQTRGLVISPPMTIDGRSVTINGTLDAQSTRIWLLFWDRLVWPTSRAISIETCEDLGWLVNEGILSRPEYTFFGDGAQGLLTTHIEAFRAQEQAEPGCWALAQGENALNVIGASLPNCRDVLVKLYQAIPVPADEVPYAEILEFKQRRLPELYRLRHELETLYEEVESSFDKGLALNKRIESIQQACSDLIKVNKEWGFASVLASLDFSVSPVGCLGTIASFLSAQQTDLDSLAKLFCGTVGSAIAFSPTIGKRIVEGKKNPYRYAYLAHNELRF